MGIRKTAFLIREAMETKKKKRKTVLYQLSNAYQALFGLRYGAFFFGKIAIIEATEIILQILSLNENSKEANLEYIVVAVTLIFLNTTISPVLMVMRNNKKCGGNRAMKLCIYLYDSLIDLLYIANNVYRGGELMNSANVKIFTNLALIHPSISLLLRARSVHRYITFKRL